MLKKIKSLWYGSTPPQVSKTTGMKMPRVFESLPQRYHTSRKVSKADVTEYIDIRRLSNLSDKWLYHIELFITDYLKYCNFELDKKGTLAYLNHIREKYHQCTYRKRMLQIRRFLSYLNLDYMEKVGIAPQPSYLPKRVDDALIEKCKTYFKGHKFERQMTAVLSLRFTGMRATEIYHLTEEDIDFEKRSIIIRKTKTGKPRIVYFNQEVNDTLLAYIKKRKRKLFYLFGEVHIRRAFRNAPMQVKDLRKYFLQEWNRRNGNYLIGEFLTGHSIKGNVTASHYVTFSDEEIKKEYRRVFD
jgi:integrase/recombinase XerD